MPVFQIHHTLSPSELPLIHNPFSPFLIISSKCVLVTSHTGFLLLLESYAKLSKFLLPPGYFTAHSFIYLFIFKLNTLQHILITDILHILCCTVPLYPVYIYYRELFIFAWHAEVKN